MISDQLAYHSYAVVLVVARLLEKHKVDEEDGTEEHGL